MNGRDVCLLLILAAILYYLLPAEKDLSTPAPDPTPKQPDPKPKKPC